MTQRLQLLSEIVYVYLSYLLFGNVLIGLL